MKVWKYDTYANLETWQRGWQYVPEQFTVLVISTMQEAKKIAARHDPDTSSFVRTILLHSFYKPLAEKAFGKKGYAEIIYCTQRSTLEKLAVRLEDVVFDGIVYSNRIDEGNKTVLALRPEGLKCKSSRHVTFDCGTSYLDQLLLPRDLWGTPLFFDMPPMPPRR